MDDENLLIIREDNIRKFWISFTTWFEGELPGEGILQPCYEEYNNWDEGYYYLSINYSMFERKIRYSEEMITSREYLDKKCALDYIIDALQFIISLQEGEKVI